MATVYTDAVFELGHRVWKPSDTDIPSHLCLKDCCRNGWGFIVRIQTYVTFRHGSVSPQLLQCFCSRRAFIYFLEIFVQIMALCKFTSRRFRHSGCHTLTTDNQPGLVALQKGFGRDDSVNLILTAFLVLATDQRWVPEFRWVSPALDIADSISRGDISIVKPSWGRLLTDSRQLEQILLGLDQQNNSGFSQSVRAMEWQWSL